MLAHAFRRVGSRAGQTTESVRWTVQSRRPAVGVGPWPCTLNCSSVQHTQMKPLMSSFHYSLFSMRQYVECFIVITSSYQTSYFDAPDATILNEVAILPHKVLLALISTSAEAYGSVRENHGFTSSCDSQRE